MFTDLFRRFFLHSFVQEGRVMKIQPLLPISFILTGKTCTHPRQQLLESNSASISSALVASLVCSLLRLKNFQPLQFYIHYVQCQRRKSLP
jgi:hypothetical protein